MTESTKNIRLSEHLREVIEERIATGYYQPGLRLDETVLAEEFDVSRTPVREALHQLSSTGLIDMRPRRGAIVTRITSQRLYEMFEVMAELEAACVRLGLSRITGDELDELEKLHELCGIEQEKNDPDSYYKINEEFHMSLYKMSHNSFLTEESSTLHRRLRPYRRLQLRVTDRLKDSYQEHVDIMEAIKLKDPALVSERIRKHINVQGERFFYLIKVIENKLSKTP